MYSLVGEESLLNINPNLLEGAFALFFLCSLLPLAAVTARRLQDADKDGVSGLGLFVLLPFLLLIWSPLSGTNDVVVRSLCFISMIIFVASCGVLSGTKGENSYGPDPRSLSN
tara:strand:- start:346 stop:684 length:339 start_codon:yes stop_codon:yes gene_type:complete